MKSILILAASLLGSTGFAVEADSTGLEGDNLDLQAVMEVFKNSESPEDFEQKLNTESTNVNNLDLNGDGEVDYIRVVDSGDSTSHVLTLQVPVNESESQDVATIELEETSEDVVQIQIVGDEELYGENYILLPGSAGNSPVIVNVIFWRPVRFMWGPRYTLWVSPWRYRAYPGWYRPWRRRPWRAYRGGVVVYRVGCRRVYRRTFVRAHTVHYRRTHSVTFVKTHKTAKTAGAKKNSSAKPASASGKPTNTKVKSAGANTKASEGAATRGIKETNQTQAAPKKSVAKEQSGGAQQKTTPQKATQKQATQKTQEKQSRKRPGGTTKSQSRKRPGGSNATKGSKSSRSSGGRKKP